MMPTYPCPICVNLCKSAVYIFVTEVSPNWAEIAKARIRRRTQIFASRANGTSIPGKLRLLLTGQIDIQRLLLAKIQVFNCPG
jgi:hypothetical protein